MSTRKQQRLAEERKNWRRDRPFGFVAKPETRPDGSLDLSVWKCLVPGKEDTPWEGGLYPVTLHFGEGYPERAPKAMFPPGFFHPNVFDNGQVCLSILNDDEEMGGAWKPSLTVKDILLGLQSLLDEPNLQSPAQDRAYRAMVSDLKAYKRKVTEQARKYMQAADDAA